MDAKKYGRSFVRAILAGMMISIGCCVFLGCYNDVKWVGAVLFAIGLMTVVAFKLDLYTGKVGYIVENPPSFLWYMPVIIVGNFVGCLITGLMMPYDVATTLVDNKLALEWYSVLFRGVFCGVLMFIAVDFFKQRNSFLALLFCVPVFILAGFEQGAVVPSIMSDEDYAGYTPIMDEDEVADFAQANGFKLTEVTDFLAPDEAFAILGDNTPEYMAEFMKTHGIDSLFYEYDYLDETDAYVYPMDDDVTEGMEPDVADAVNQAFDDWNDEVDETDFSAPALLYFYAIYQGRVFGIEMWNPDFEKYLEDDPMLTCLCQCLGGLKLPETED